MDISAFVRDSLFLFFILLFIILSVAAGIYKRRYLSSFKKLEKSLKKNEELNSFIKIFSETLSNVGDISTTYSTIAEHVANIIDAKGVCIYELREDNCLHAASFNDNFPPLVETTKFLLSKPRFPTESLKHERIKLGQCIVGEVAESGKGILLEDAEEDPRLFSASKILPVKTLIAVPMKTHGKVIGVICVVNSRNDQPFTQQQYNSMITMSNLIMLVHSIIKTYSDMSKQERISQELEFARLLQASLLPRNNPEWSQFVIHAFTRSAKEVSGDFFDFVEIDQDRLLVVIGDASGKGVPACLMMAMTRSFIRANIDRFTGLGDMLDELNSNLYRDTDTGRFVTLACCLLDRKYNTVEFARAGHTELMIYSSKYKLRKIHPKGSALGLLPKGISGSYDVFKFTFKPYYSMMLYSDGIIEAVNKEEEEFGQKRLEELFYDSCKKRNSPVKCTEKVLSAIENYSSEREQDDDQTIVVISHKDAII